jgi:hypothetical protein
MELRRMPQTIALLESWFSDTGGAGPRATSDSKAANGRNRAVSMRMGGPDARAAHGWTLDPVYA